MTIKGLCLKCKNRVCLDPKNMRKGLLCDRAMSYTDRDTVKEFYKTNTYDVNIVEGMNDTADHNRHKRLHTTQEVGSSISVETDTLTHIQAVVLRLFEIEGKSYADIARHLSGPGKRFNKTKIKNILYQARKKIKDTVKTVDI